MLQDSKVLPLVENWSDPSKCLDDSASNSPKIENDQISQDHKDVIEELKKENDLKIALNENETVTSEECVPDINLKSDETVEHRQENTDISATAFDSNDIKIVQKTKNSDVPQTDYQEETVALAIKLLEEWSSLKEVFRIPKKERIEQMKEHEREADMKYRANLALQQDTTQDKPNEHRYRYLRKKKKDNTRQEVKEDLTIKINKHERRKMFAMQVEFNELERRRKQQEMWQQHEQRCLMMGTDPRLTAPYDPNQGFQYIWNSQLGQWQNFPLPSNPSPHFNLNFQNMSNNSINQYQQMSNSIQQLQPTSMHLPQNQTPGQLGIPINQPPPVISNMPSNISSVTPHLPPQMQCSQTPPIQIMNACVPPNQHMMSIQQQFRSNLNPSSLNMPSTLNLQQNLSIPPPHINMPNISVPPNVNVASNQGLLPAPTLNLQQTQPLTNQMIPSNFTNVSSGQSLLPATNITLPPTQQIPNLVMTSGFAYNMSGVITPVSTMQQLPLNSSIKSVTSSVPYQESICKAEDPSEVRYDNIIVLVRCDAQDNYILLV